MGFTTKSHPGIMHDGAVVVRVVSGVNITSQLKTLDAELVAFMVSEPSGLGSCSHPGTSTFCLDW